MSQVVEISAFDRGGRALHGPGVADPYVPRREAEALTAELQMRFGKRLETWRLYRDMTRRELSAFADLSEDTIRIYEEGRIITDEADKAKKKKRTRRLGADLPRRPTDPALFSGVVRLALALGVTIQQLLYEDPPSDPDQAKAG